MNIQTHKEQITAIHNWLTNTRRRAQAARDKATPQQHHHLMLCGKVKAYTDAICFIENRYGHWLIK